MLHAFAFFRGIGTPTEVNDIVKQIFVSSCNNVSLVMNLQTSQNIWIVNHPMVAIIWHTIALLVLCYMFPNAYVDSSKSLGTGTEKYIKTSEMKHSPQEFMFRPLKSAPNCAQTKKVPPKSRWSQKCSTLADNCDFGDTYLDTLVCTVRCMHDVVTLRCYLLN